ncbi:aldose epimerase family protein [Halobacillus karajensis]|uniref:Aldose 1-epimerase n=1 Tax=Halobacillus karajensis TaxID=195088 RepID=A0A059NVE0_9BACI|nr:hypothetical protein [Halobacillus karajensis]CDQ18880.1 Aldose 1-epimerase [Halobacillus karajensis]CDQ23047.1 Aldose 1-epimerase [Halobacillus karajensis]CDQ26529.1 Aldose 1-epimerase [Halobacillus karajensis]
MVDVCTYQKTKFKGLDAVVLENERVRAVILPEYGGKMVSFFDKVVDYEWLSQIDQPILDIPPKEADFSDYDLSGFDEIFTSLDRSLSDRKDIPAHGEVWTLPWAYNATNDGVALQVRHPEIPYTLKKRICLHSDGLKIKYEAVNQSEEPLPFLWTPHALLNADDNAEIEVPDGMTHMIKVEKEQMGSPGSTHSNSVFTKHTGETNGVETKKRASIERFSFTQPLTEGWCSLVQPHINRKLTYHFSEAKVPYLGVSKIKGRKQKVALVPCTCDSQEVNGKDNTEAISSIPAQDSCTWTFSMNISKL